MSPTAAVRFPDLEARNLNGKRIYLPSGFGGTRNIVLIAFRRWHQAMVDSWFPYLERLMSTHQDLRAYELPLISSVFALARPFIDGGMASAIPDPRVRERTLTVYTDVERVTATLHIRNRSTITVLLVDRDGQIYWRSEGPYSPERAAGLERALT
ncbi:MAG: hypothetical protein SNJ69_01325 [Chloroflexaceae bacterium]